VDVAEVLTHKFVHDCAAWNVEAILAFQESHLLGSQMAHVRGFQISVVVERDIGVR
jgi:hypothetical protein